MVVRRPWCARGPTQVYGNNVVLPSEHQLPGTIAMPRFAILAHDHPTLHWDLFLEAGSGLRTWRLTAPPEDGIAISADAIGDHRLMYLTYEGPVSGGRGFVERWDEGSYDIVQWETDRIDLIVTGNRIGGR